MQQISYHQELAQSEPKNHPSKPKLKITKLQKDRSPGEQYLSLVMRKPFFCICENKDADQLRGNREADQRFCFRYTDSTFPLLLNPKFQVSSHLLCLYRMVCVGPCRKRRRPVFSQRGSFSFECRLRNLIILANCCVFIFQVIKI